MIENDTIKLLRECDAGVRMGTESIDQVTPSVRSAQLLRLLVTCRSAHMELGKEIRAELDRFEDKGKKPNPMASAMSKAETGVKLAVDGSDATVASLMTDGCNMGVKSLNRYLNQYEAAEEFTKDITKRLIHLEEQLVTDVRGYL